MANQEIRDKSGNLKGIISQSGSKMELRDKNGNLKGIYYPDKTETRDKTGNLIGKGNLLATML